jgi:hypothetical protein
LVTHGSEREQVRHGVVDVGRESPRLHPCGELGIQERDNSKLNTCRVAKEFWYSNFSAVEGENNGSSVEANIDESMPEKDPRIAFVDRPKDRRNQDIPMAHR